jgi:hypothetical protein
MAPKAKAMAAPGLSEREKSRLRVGVLADRDIRNWLYEPVLGDHPEAVVVKGRAPAPFVSATTPAERIEARTPRRWLFLAPDSVGRRTVTVPAAVLSCYN